MSANKDLWEKINKLPGGDKDPFETPWGPTKNCLSSDQLVAYVRDGVRDLEVVEHISKCSTCSERVIRFSIVTTD